MGLDAVSQRLSRHDPIIKSNSAGNEARWKQRVNTMAERGKMKRSRLSLNVGQKGNSVGFSDKDGDLWLHCFEEGRKSNTSCSLGNRNGS